MGNGEWGGGGDKVSGGKMEQKFNLLQAVLILVSFLASNDWTLEGFVLLRRYYQGTRVRDRTLQRCQMVGIRDVSKLTCIESKLSHLLL